jgi:hypothetical protein
VALQLLADFQRTLHRRIRRRGKKERHPIAGWESNQSARRFRVAKRLCASDNLIKLLQQLMFFVNEELRVADDVYE